MDWPSRAVFAVMMGLLLAGLLCALVLVLGAVAVAAAAVIQVVRGA